MEIITNTVNKAVSMGTLLPPRSFLVRVPLHPLGPCATRFPLPNRTTIARGSTALHNGRCVLAGS